MARITVEDCLHDIENRFALCVLTVRRGRQLMTGAKPVVDPGKDKEKAPVLSLREIAAGKVHPDRNLQDVLAGKFNAPPVEMKLVPAGSTKPSAPPSGGLF